MKKQFFEEGGLPALGENIMSEKDISLDDVFYVKARKVETTFTIIVAERGSWQLGFVKYLQGQLNTLNLPNSFLVTNYD